MYLPVPICLKRKHQFLSQSLEVENLKPSFSITRFSSNVGYWSPAFQSPSSSSSRFFLPGMLLHDLYPVPLLPLPVYSQYICQS